MLEEFEILPGKCSFIAVHRGEEGRGGGGFSLFSPRPIIFLHPGSSTNNHDERSTLCRVLGVPRRQLVVAETPRTLSFLF